MTASVPCTTSKTPRRPADARCEASAFCGSGFFLRGRVFERTGFRVRDPRCRSGVSGLRSDTSSCDVEGIASSRPVAAARFRPPRFRRSQDARHPARCRHPHHRRACSRITGRLGPMICCVQGRGRDVLQPRPAGGKDSDRNNTERSWLVCPRSLAIRGATDGPCSVARSLGPRTCLIRIFPRLSASYANRKSGLR